MCVVQTWSAARPKWYVCCTYDASRRKYSLCIVHIWSASQPKRYVPDFELKVSYFRKLRMYEIAILSCQIFFQSPIAVNVMFGPLLCVSYRSVYQSLVSI